MPLKHSHVFTADGMFGSKDAEGDTVDDGSYELVRLHHDHHEGVGKVTFDFTADDQTLVLTPVAKVRKGGLLRCPVGGRDVISRAGVEAYGVAAETTCGRWGHSNQSEIRRDRGTSYRARRTSLRQLT
jgi:hypothetical protein